MGETSTTVMGLENTFVEKLCSMEESEMMNILETIDASDFDREIIKAKWRCIALTHDIERLRRMRQYIKECTITKMYNPFELGSMQHMYDYHRKGFQQKIRSIKEIAELCKNMYSLKRDHIESMFHDGVLDDDMCITFHLSLKQSLDDINIIEDFLESSISTD